MTLSEKIYLLRKREGLSQDELADKLGVSRQSVYKWESGASMPELEKIKILSKLFDVSFDYLLNDDQKDVNDTAKRHTYRYRKIFSTKVPLNSAQADIDYGIPENEEIKRHINLDEENYEARRYLAKKFLQDIGATDIVFPHPIAAVAFFYDNTNKVIGFYYAGQVQFVCPIENIVSFDYSGGDVMGANGTTLFSAIGSSMLGASTYTRNANAWAILSYKDGESVRQFEMKFTVANKYVLNDAFKEKSNFVSTAMHIHWDINMEKLLKNLNIIRIKILGLKQEASEILNGQRRVNELDVTFYSKKNKPWLEEYRSYLEKIEADFSSAKRNGCLAKILLWGIVIFIIIVILNSIFP